MPCTIVCLHHAERNKRHSCAHAGIVRPLVDVARIAQKEKVFRVALSSLRNLLEDEDLHNNLASEMIDAGLQKIVATRQLQGSLPAEDCCHAAAAGDAGLQVTQACRRLLPRGSCR